VVLMQENRSFDHYFGTLSATRGFSDPAVLSRAGRPVYDQAGFRPGHGADPAGFLQPFRLQSHPPKENGQSTNDIAHDWVTQHKSWNHGAMDKFVTSHLAADGAANGPVTMGYFTRADLPFYYALADAFTICDGYFCSVLGPTDPNRVMAMSGTIDPAGTAGGPVLITRETDRVAHYGRLHWETMPERLLDAGVSWKVYNDPLGLLALNPLPYFKAFTNPVSSRSRALIAHGVSPSYPGDFAADVAHGKLPSVSWIIPPLAECEHPAAPPAFGEFLVSQVLATLVAHPAVWAQRVFIVCYDENGGFFDHVPPAGHPGRDGGGVPDRLPVAVVDWWRRRPGRARCQRRRRAPPARRSRDGPTGYLVKERATSATISGTAMTIPATIKMMRTGLLRRMSLSLSTLRHARLNASVVAEEHEADYQVSPVGDEVSPDDRGDDPHLAVPQHHGVPALLVLLERGELALRAEVDYVGLAAALVRPPEPVEGVPAARVVAAPRIVPAE
jgi:hypothetical protein